MQIVTDYINNYKIIEVIGSGGMAIVYKAQTADGQIVALKLLSDTLSMNDNIRQRFKRESNIMSQLNHWGIVRVFDYGEIENRPYLVMEYMSSGSLEQYFSRGVRITLEQSLHLLQQIADALDYAHSQTTNKQSVIHRDLKLDNILVDNNRRVALSDFGLARIQNDKRVSITGAMLGTLMYISPEQIRSFKDVDYRTDLYALGVIAYLLFTGTFPFSGETQEEFIIKHLKHQPAKPTDVNRDLPDTANDVLLKALAKNPNERYTSSNELVDALKIVISTCADLSVDVYSSSDGSDRGIPMNFSDMIEEFVLPANKFAYRNKFIGTVLIIVIILSVVLFLIDSRSQTVQTFNAWTPSINFNTGS